MNGALRVFSQSYTLSGPQDQCLYPTTMPFNEGYLTVSKRHSIWFEEYGNPHGLPVLAVHGGPGGGSNSRDSRLFNPQNYRIILFDQRGSGKSIPHAEIEENSTAHLIEDMESLRLHLGISQWVLLGGSWGSALSLLYAERHPSRVLGLLLRGIFLATKFETQKLWHEMGDFYPEVFEEYSHHVPENERHDLAHAFYKRLTSADEQTARAAAHAFYKYDMMCATLLDKSALKEIDPLRALALSKIFAHYCAHHFFVSPDQIINNIGSISDKPLYIVHGRYDIICRASTAYQLYKAWPSSKLTIVPDAGHSQREPGITKALMEAADNLFNQIKK